MDKGMRMAVMENYRSRNVFTEFNVIYNQY